MSPGSRTALTALISCLLAFTGFMILLQNVPADLILTREQAINVVKTSAKVDPEKTIIKDKSLQSVELRYMPINWVNYLRTSGSHSRIYVSTSQVGDIKPYWFIDYLSNYTFGSYIVDATTGELMLAQEGSEGPAPGPDFSITTVPAYANDPYFPVVVKQGQASEVILLFAARPSYDASLSISIRVTAVPKGFTVTQNVTSGILRTGGTLVIKLVISSSVYAPGTNPPPFDSTPPHLEIEEGPIGTIYGSSIYLQSIP
jgi:hypothetical protein